MDEEFPFSEKTVFGKHDFFFPPKKISMDVRGLKREVLTSS